MEHCDAGGDGDAVRLSSCGMERYGEGFEESVQAIWREAGKGQGALARGFAMPLKNAPDVAEAYSSISTPLLGP